MKILITGGAGFIGSNLANKLSKEHSITIVDDLSMGSRNNISKLPNIVFYEKSVLDVEFMKDLLVNENFEYIFHLAAVASVADSIERPLETNQINFMSTLIILNILKDMKTNSLKRMVFASSAAVYGDDVILPKTEVSPVKPITPYAIDKYAAERYVLAYNNLYGIPTSCVRFFNVFGPNQNSSSPYSGVISIIIDKFEKKINNEISEFNLYGDGEQSRDFVYIEDVINAIEIVACSDDSLGEVYNVGTGRETTLNRLIEIISSILNTSINIEVLEEREGDIRNSVCSIEKLKSIGYRPQYTVDEGLKNYIKYLNIEGN